MSATVPVLGADVVRIRPAKGWSPIRLRELWEYRELLFFLIWRDVKVRYKQTLLGAAWAVLQPLLTMIVFTIFFGNLAGVSSDGLPYPLFSYAGLLPWTFFAHGLTQSSDSLVSSSNLIKKVFFPRLVIPIASVSSGAVDFAFAFLLLVGMMAFYGIWPALTVLAIVPLLLLAITTSLGAGLWLSALNVQYRDVRYVVPFFVQLWLFVTPVIYPASTVVAKLEARGLPAWLYGLNPMSGVVEGFRWAVLGRGTPPGPLLGASALVAIVLLVSGAFYFRRMEKAFADVV
ncbi:MAG TPA: ABC transporter permease [Thermoanaerobaculia bacterium]|jgi:lipopolysaccharide transport system permease protein